MTPLDFVIRPLALADAPLAAAFMASQPADHVRFFHVFGSDAAKIGKIIGALERDVYSGVFWRGELICVFLLRGWDAGHEVPSFGLVVARDHGRREVLAAAFAAAKLIARMAGAKRMMCKVHPENVAGTRGALGLGWLPDHQEPGTGNTVYHYEL